MNFESETFRPTEGSIHAAREFVRQALLRRGHRHEDAVLVVSELATNAVRHARTAFTVTVRDDGSGVEIGVSDDSRVLPAVGRVDQSGGYGLRIVERVSLDWGIEGDSDGKRIWSRLSYPTPEA